ncbi:hypothetical protein [Candidatus Mycobacterium methanotrophicum]|uniref:PIN domain-containing protein n=1 Tax=Candidatus Mycobacterium methanotrophicum TaxID=2943498 RepID=A0ABY4QPB7_9MYCO|nr:hypothetical protein [Candidatus Mycobacterium methanotrophicum]UQX11470.1 hypothetical protein M5I08_02850 [Candidatus Mycobacterium methanotrophicum]
MLARVKRGEQTDAIHFATRGAVFGTQLTAFVCYDERLLAAAAAVGLPTAAPGR